MAIAKVRLATFLHPRFWFLLCSSSWLKTLLTQHTSHASRLRSTQTEILNFPVNHILQVSCDWILCCDWYALHGKGRQTALWPCPRPFPSGLATEDSSWSSKAICSRVHYAAISVMPQYLQCSEQCWHNVLVPTNQILDRNWYHLHYYM